MTFSCAECHFMPTLGICMGMATNQMDHVRAIVVSILYLVALFIMAGELAVLGMCTYFVLALVACLLVCRNKYAYFWPELERIK